MNITQKEIAETLGVSESTVSLALSNSSKVKKETREKVEKLSKVVKYRPSEIARSLSIRKTSTIGLIIPNFVCPFSSALTEKIQRQLEKRHYLPIALVANTPEERRDALEVFLQRRVDGIICSGLSYEEIFNLKEENIPFVITDQVINLNVDYVAVDKYKGAYMAVEHLINLGYKKIAFLCSPDKTEPRFLGYKDALHHYHLPVKSEWILPDPGYYKTGYDNMRKFLSLKEKRPDAIFAKNDVSAIGAMKAMKDAGLKIPEDIAIVGFDNIEAGEYSNVSLTTIDQPKAEIARKLTDVLLTKIENGNDAVLQQIIIEPKLIIRESCGYYLKKSKKERNSIKIS